MALSITCTHEKGCSKPDRYWRVREYSEIIDGECLLVENALPDPVSYTFGAIFSCTECGAEARIAPSEKKSKSKSKARTLPLL